MRQKSTIRDGGPCPLRYQGNDMNLMSWAIILITTTGQEPEVVSTTFKTQAECTKRMEQIKRAVSAQNGIEPEIACYLKVENKS